MSIEEQEIPEEESEPEDTKTKKRKPFEEHAVQLPPARAALIGEPMLLKKTKVKEGDEKPKDDSGTETIRNIRRQIPQRTKPINKLKRKGPQKQSPLRHPRKSI